MARQPDELLGTEDLIAAARAALDASSGDAPSAVFALHERAPLDAATLLLDVASGRTGASQMARERASDFAKDLVSRDTFNQLLATIIRPGSVRGVPAKFLFDFHTLFAVFGLSWVSDVDLFAAARRDESARVHALLRLTVATPRPDRLLADEWIGGRAADAILERVFADLDGLDWVRLGVHCESYQDDDDVAIRFWVWGAKGRRLPLCVRRTGRPRWCARRLLLERRILQPRVSRTQRPRARPRS